MSDTLNEKPTNIGLHVRCLDDEPKAHLSLIHGVTAIMV